MIMGLLAILVIILSFGLFTLSYQVIGMNRLIIYTPITEIERFVLVEGDNKLHFYDQQVRVNLDLYYQEKIHEYTNKYEVKYYFYHKEDHSYCAYNFCDSVEIEVDATLYMSYQYHRKIYFEVRNQNELS